MAAVAMLVAPSAATVYNRSNLAITHSMQWWNETLLGPLREELARGELRRVTITWIGDSTTRNQMHFLCDVLTGDPSDGECGDQAFTLVKGAEMGGASPPWDLRAANLEKHFHIAEPEKSRSASVLSVVYFGSTLLHAMHLMPHSEWRGFEIDQTLAEGLPNVVAQIRAARMCPVFHTINWVCDRAYTGKYADTVSKARRDGGAVFRQACEYTVSHHNWRPRRDKNKKPLPGQQPPKPAPAEVDLCVHMPLTSWGSDYGAALELAAIRAIDGPPVETVNMHAITKHQCWATTEGRHYDALLPQKLTLVIHAVRACALQFRAAANQTGAAAANQTGAAAPNKTEAA